MKLKNIALAVWTGLLLGASLTAVGQVFTAQHNFTNSPDGANPKQLVWSDGLFYGPRPVAEPMATGQSTCSTPTGRQPPRSIISRGRPEAAVRPTICWWPSNMIYGTTSVGGTNNVGMVYAVNTNGTGFTPLYSFAPSPDGIYPLAGLILDGATLYGTAHAGGTNSGGTLFKINTNGTGYAILHWFTNSPDGNSPQSELVLGGGTLFGTTAYGGANSNGTIFSISTNGTGYAILHSFTNYPDGKYPYGGLVLNSNTLYGTTGGGGSNNTGTAFAINTDGSGFTILHHFTGLAGNLDGSIPKGTLALAGTSLFGTASGGGSGNGGTVFKVSTNGGGFAVVKSFTYNPGDGNDLENGVALLGNTVWGTTYSGGTGTYGLLYSLLLSPAITVQPQSTTVTNGNPATFTVTATDNTATNYQWYFNTNTRAHRPDQQHPNYRQRH